MKVYRYFLLALLVIVIDQASKLLIHHYMDLHEEITVIGNEQHGFKLHYLLNPGMAFGIRWNNEFGSFEKGKKPGVTLLSNDFNTSKKL